MTKDWEQLASHIHIPEIRQGQDNVGNEADYQLLLKAKHALRCKDYTATHKLLTRYLDTIDSESYIALEMRSLCYLHSQSFSEALDDALLVTKLNPIWSRGWARLGTCQLCCSHPKAAVSAYKKGLSMEPNNPEMLLGLKLAEEALLSQGKRRIAAHEVVDLV